MLTVLNSQAPIPDITKVTLYILTANIETSSLNVEYPRFTNLSLASRARIKTRFPKFYQGRFTAEEDSIIYDNWNQLCQKCNISDPQKFHNYLCTKSNFTNSFERRHRNVIGCYLGQGLVVLRHASDVFFHAIQILNPLRTGTFTTDEDTIILDEVAKRGDNNETWKAIALLLNRDVSANGFSSIRRRYRRCLMVKRQKTGIWKLDEDRMLLESLFKDRERTIETINSMTISDFSNISEVKRKMVQNVF